MTDERKGKIKHEIINILMAQRAQVWIYSALEKGNLNSV